MNKFEVSNYEGLDESISNALGLKNNEKYSNAVDIGAISQGVTALAGVYKGYQDSENAQKQRDFERKMEQDRANRERQALDYDMKKQQLELEKAKLLAQAQARQIENQPIASGTPATSGGKFLGMPKAVGITVTVVGGLALIGGTILLIMKLRKK